jgi:hypothetical protein
LGACPVDDYYTESEVYSVGVWASTPACPAHDDGSFEEKVRELVFATRALLYDPTASGDYFSGRKELLVRLSTVEEALKGRGRVESFVDSDDAGNNPFFRGRGR